MARRLRQRLRPARRPRRRQPVATRADAPVLPIVRDVRRNPLPPGAGDFRLLDRKAVDALLRMRERARFSKGLYAWIGFKSVGVPFDVAERGQAATSKFSYRKLTRFALDGLTSFSTTAAEGVDLRRHGHIDFRACHGGLFHPAHARSGRRRSRLCIPDRLRHVFRRVQLLSLGVIGEYIGRIFAEVKGRPLYIVARHLSVDEREQRRRGDRRIGRAAE